MPQQHKCKNVVRHAMKLYILIIILSLIQVFGCNPPNDKVDSYIEAQPSFFDLRHGDPTKNVWIRDPKNLLMVHETLKKIGYNHLINESLLTESPFIAQGVYIDRPLRQILDSLEITYNLETIHEKYYREFWQRRKSEHNDSVVYVIVKEINSSIKNRANPPVNNDLVNDTLYNLAFIECRLDTLNYAIAKDNFSRLKQFGFHQSAYNLLFEMYKYYEIDWNRDSLKGTLIKSNTFIYPWFPDDTK